MTPGTRPTPLFGGRRIVLTATLPRRRPTDRGRLGKTWNIGCFRVGREVQRILGQGLITVDAMDDQTGDTGLLLACRPCLRHDLGLAKCLLPYLLQLLLGLEQTTLLAQACAVTIAGRSL